VPKANVTDLFVFSFNQIKDKLSF